MTSSSDRPHIPISTEASTNVPERSAVRVVDPEAAVEVSRVPHVHNAFQGKPGAMRSAWIAM